MRNTFFVVFTLIVWFMAQGAWAQSALIPSPPELGAKSYVLMDGDSGRVLVSREPDKQLAPASLTKMMTAYIADREMAEGRLSLSDETTVSESAWRTGGSRMFLEEGGQVSVEDLMRGIIVQSGNDASVALAEHIAGGEGSFAQMMNQQAQQLGMENSSFTNSTGMPDPDMYTTAYDMALLSKAKINHFPESYDVYSERYFTFNDIRQPNRNRLLWRDQSVDGLKTGHTTDAGYCLAAAAKRDDMRLIAVVMGADSEEARARQAQQLLNYGFRYFETERLYEAGEKVLEAEVWSGAEDSVDLGLEEDLYVTIPTGGREEMESTVEVDSTLRAPLQAGEVYGELELTLEGDTLAERDLVALHDVEEGGFFKRVWDAIKLFFYQLFS